MSLQGIGQQPTATLGPHAGRQATALDQKRRIVVVSNGLPEMIRRDVADAGSLPEEASPGSTGHLFVLLVFLLLSFVLRSKLGLLLLFLFAFIFFSLITHIRLSLLEPTFPKRRLLSNVTEPPRRYCTHFQQPHAR